MSALNALILARCAALAFLSLGPSLAEAVSLTCEGAVSKTENVDWGTPTISMQVSFTEAFRSGELATSEELIGKNVVLSVEAGPAAINARQLVRQRQGDNSFGISTLTISRKTGRFYMQADLRSTASPLPLMLVSWTGSCEKTDPAKNKF